MKYVILVGDGMADRPIEELDARTPLEAAENPNMDSIAREGRCGLMRTLWEDLPFGSDVANLGVLGYNPSEYLTGGRGPLEAAALGIDLGPDDLAFRCNLITTEEGKIKDHSAGHISSEEASILVNKIQEELGTEDVHFYPGKSYRNILVMENFSDEIKCFPPHDHLGEKIQDYLIQGTSKEGKETAKYLNSLIEKSRGILKDHPLNQGRENPANCLWFWGPGKKLEMPSFQEVYGLSGALISAVDLLKGIASYLDMTVIDVPGATGYLDTDYEKKAEYALSALDSHDLVYLHVEAVDEASHEGSIEKKIKAIEDLDSLLIGNLLAGLDERGYSDETTIALLPDHATPIELKTHSNDLVPFAIKKPGKKPDAVEKFTEKEATNGYYGERSSLHLIDPLLIHEP